ncbi:hypothetical protein MJ581_21490 [Escherichia coli]|nr:hypothetical protein MJ581_21490 [Escherichia coli]
MFSNHADMMLTQIAIGLCFTLLYFVVFRTLILQFNMCTPGREDAEVALLKKPNTKPRRGKPRSQKELDQAAGILQTLGGRQYLQHQQLRDASTDYAKRHVQTLDDL